MKSRDGSYQTSSVIALVALLFLSTDAIGQFELLSPTQNHARVDWPTSTSGHSLVDSNSLDRLHSPILSRDRKILGAQSCGAASCHGGPRPGVSQPGVRRGGEYMLWLENDPHAESWRTLCGSASTTMMRRLKIIDAAGNVLDQSGFDNCLACHNSTQRFDEPRSLVRDRRRSEHAPCYSTPCETQPPTYDAGDVSEFSREGVGCSACHGPSEQWIGTHGQFDFSPLASTNTGFVANGDLYTRARVCASCHVGDKDRDMNHDIIAAGHPVLRYEFATSHNRLPKHWRDPAMQNPSFYEAQLWLAGQIASTDASLSLLQSRSSASLPTSVWPELASYNCASCHHELGFEKQRGERTSSGSATALASRWDDAGLRWLLDNRIRRGEANAADLELVHALDRVRQWLESRAQPEPAEMALRAETARHALARWFDSISGASERSSMDSDRLNELITFAAGQRETFATVESASQYYLASVAARSRWPGGTAGAMRRAADRLRNHLKNPSRTQRTELRELGIEMAGWLGPVKMEPISQRPSAWEDTSEIAPSERLKSILGEIKERWKNRDQALAEEVEKIRLQRERDAPTPNRPKLQLDELQEQRKRNTDEANKGFDSNG